jgi:ribosomal protein S4
MVFYRRRLLPTVFACHQFIHHHGLEVNGFPEKSPRALVAVGDTVSVPQSA